MVPTKRTEIDHRSLPGACETNPADFMKLEEENPKMAGTTSAETHGPALYRDLTGPYWPKEKLPRCKSLLSTLANRQSNPNKIRGQV